MTKVIIGHVHFIDSTKVYGANGFRKRVLVLEQDKDRFTNYIPIEFVKDDCESLDGLSVGDYVEVEYKLSGRKWQKNADSEVKYFLNAEGLSFNVMKSTEEKPTYGEAIKPGDADNSIPDDQIPF